VSVVVCAGSRNESRPSRCQPLRGARSLSEGHSAPPVGRRALRSSALRTTLYYMSTLTVRLDDDLQQRLDAVSRRSGRSKSSVVRDILRRHLLREEVRQLRAEIMPFAESRGYLTDEDVFDDVS